MESLYSETYLEAKTPKKRQQKRMGLILLCILLLVIDVFILHSAIGLFLVVVADGVIIALLPTKKIAYEYVFVDGQTDFDCIYGDSKARKTLAKADLDKTEVVAPENSHALDAYQTIKCEDYSSGYEEHTHYIMVYRDEQGTMKKIRFTPDEKMLENMKMKARSKIKD